MNLKDQILNSLDSRVEPLEVPAWNCTIFLRTMTAKARAQLQHQWREDDNLNDLPFQVLLLSVCDQDGTLIFTEDDRPALEQKNGQVIHQIAIAAMKLNGLSSDAVAEAKKN